MDRVLLAAASRILPGDRWGLVQPADAPSLASGARAKEMDLPIPQDQDSGHIPAGYGGSVHHVP
jgi:hypothetical protein